MKKIWADPVWSKVISVGIIALLGVLTPFLLRLFGFKDFTFEKAFIIILDCFKDFTNYKISIGQVIIGIIILVILLLVVKFIVSRANKSKINYKESAIKNFKSHYEAQPKVSYTWTVYLQDNDVPFIVDLNAFCHHHNPPLRFITDRCPDPTCLNHHRPIEISLTKNHIESMLIHIYNNMDSKGQIPNSSVSFNLRPF